MKPKITLSLQGIVDSELKTLESRIIYAREHLAEIVEGLEIGFFAHKIDDILESIEDNVVLEAIQGFQANSLHIAGFAKGEMNSKILDRVISLANDLYERESIKSIGYHLDMVEYFDYIRSSSISGLQLNWENLGSDASSCNTIEEVALAAQRFPEWGVTLDVAHILEMVPFGQPSIEEYLEKVGDYIKQIHLSWPGNLYSRDLVGPNTDARHSLLCVDTKTTSSLIKLISKLIVDTITIEGVIPLGREGIRFVKDEVSLIKKNLA